MKETENERGKRKRKGKRKERRERERRRKESHTRMCEKEHCPATKKGSLLTGGGHYFFSLYILRNVSTL